MIEFIKKYWWGAILLIVAILLPLGLNWLILRPSRFEVVGDGTHWLSFWATYISAIASFAMIGVTLYVLNKQLVQNQNENEENRKANAEQNDANRLENEKQNKINRDMQLQIIEYNRELSQLLNFKKVCIEYINNFESNKIRQVRSLMPPPNGLDMALEEVKKLFIQSSLVNTKMGLSVCPSYILWRRNNYEEKYDEYDEYSNILSDIQTLLQYTLIQEMNISVIQFRHAKTIEYIKRCTEGCHVNLAEVLNLYIEDVSGIYDESMKKFLTYFTWEEKRIREKLTISGTEIKVEDNDTK